jgi:hypothetical protein
MTDENILHKIRQLFAMAEHEASNEHEAAIALEKAQEMLFKHNLSRASIGNVDEGPTSQGIGKVDITEQHGYPWKKSLAHVIARNNLCRVITSNHAKTIHIFGTPDNVRSVLEMYYWLAEQLIRLAGPGYREYKHQGGFEAARTWNSGFYHGAITTLKERLKKPLEEFSQGPGHALVLTNAALVDAGVKRIYPHTSKSQGSYRMGDGYFSGKTAGNNVTIGRARPLSGARPALAGR